MIRPAFDTLADLYDLLVDWEKRLPRETAFLERVLDRHGARTVLDAACGTGRHLEALARRGFAVAGSDIAPEMVERARERLGNRGEVRPASFEETAGLFPPQDAVLVIGNSLPNAGTPEGVRRALRSLAACVRPGGVLLLHMLNYERLREEGGGLRPLRRVSREGREYLFLKLFEIHPDKVVLDVIALVTEGGEITPRLMRTELCPIRASWLAGVLGECGLEVDATYGGFGGAEFDERESGDLVVVARKTGEST